MSWKLLKRHYLKLENKTVILDSNNGYLNISLFHFLKVGGSSKIMNRMKSALLIILIMTSSLFNVDEMTVHAEKNVDGSVYEYFQQQDKGTDQDETEKKSLPPKNETAETTSQQVGVTVWDIVKTIFMLVIVIGMLFGLLKWLQKKNNVSPSVQTMKNLGGTNLGGNRSVQMIKVGNSILVVGIGENVELLKEINDEQEVNMIIDQYHNRMEQMVKPQDMISKLTARLKTKKENAEENQSFKKELEKQLHGIAEKRRKAYEENVEKGFKDK